MAHEAQPRSGTREPRSAPADARSDDARASDQTATGSEGRQHERQRHRPSDAVPTTTAREAQPSEVPTPAPLPTRRPRVRDPEANRPGPAEDILPNPYH